MNDRRDFMKRVCRLSLFGGLAVGGVHLAGQPKSTESQDATCAQNGVCRSCPVLGKCAHPNAVSFKEAVK